MKDKKQEDKELISYMAQTLREHSAPYREGAWEKFASLNGPTRKRVMWPYLSGAAMLLLAAALFWLRSPEQPPRVQETPSVVDNKIAVAQKAEPEAPADTDTAAIASKRGEIDREVRPKNREGRLATMLVATLPDDNVKGPLMSQPSIPDGKTQVLDKTSDETKPTETPVMGLKVAEAATNPSKQTEGQEDRFLKMLQQEQVNASARQPEKSLKNENASASKQKKWDLGIALAPAATRDRFNFGGGVEVAYRLSDRVSVGTGISMAGLGVQRSDQQIYSPRKSASLPQASPAMGLSSTHKLAAADEQLADKQLESVRTSVLGLDIPLNFKYNIGKSFYASAGASFFAVVNETRTNVYVKQVTSTESFNSINGASAVQPIIETQRISEKTADKPLINSDFNGFINFSVGHRIPLSGKIQVGLEPFIKLPLGRAAKQDVNLSYGGIKLSAGF